MTGALPLKPPVKGGIGSPAHQPPLIPSATPTLNDPPGFASLCRGKPASQAEGWTPRRNFADPVREMVEFDLGDLGG